MKSKLFYLTMVIVSILLFCGCEKELNIKDMGNLVPKTVDQDPTLPSIKINGTELHSEAFGNPTCIFR